MRPAPSRFIAAALAVSLAAGCVAPGDFPSLLPRPQELAGDGAEPAPALVADDPLLPGRLAALVAEALAGQAAFEAELPQARAAAARAGAPGSDSWVEAQQAVSRLEAARAATTHALGELDALALAEVRTRPVSAADLARIDDAVVAVGALAAAQSRQVETLAAAVRSG